MTTSGDLWWSDVVEPWPRRPPDGAGALRGQAPRGPSTIGGDERVGGLPDPLRRGRHGPGAGRRWSTGRAPGNPAGAGGVRLIGSTVIERVVQRWFDAGLCHCVPFDCNLARCFGLVRQAANAVHETWRRRAQSVYGADRASLEEPGRCAGSQVHPPGLRGLHPGHVGGPAVSGRHRRLPEGQHRDLLPRRPRAERAVGLQRGPGRRRGPPPASGPTRAGHRIAEDGVLATGGAETLADATGGTLTVSNDLAAGLERMALDSTAYYLLGYQPEGRPDGRWHDLKVAVRPARGEGPRPQGLPGHPPRGPRPGEGEAGREAGPGPGRRARRASGPSPPTLLAGQSRDDGLPLRVAAYVRDNDGVGKARVQVVVEVDNSRVRIDRVPTPWRATLDLTILAAGLEREPLVPFDERLHMSLSPGEVAPGWWLVPRDVWLPPGVDAAPGLRERRPVGDLGPGHPAARRPRRDRALPVHAAPHRSDAPRLGAPTSRRQLVPTATGRFGGTPAALCRYEVFTFGGETLRGVPRLFGSYLLQGPDGLVVSADRTDAHRDRRAASGAPHRPSRGGARRRPLRPRRSTSRTAWPGTR